MSSSFMEILSQLIILEFDFLTNFSLVGIYMIQIFKLQIRIHEFMNG